MKPKPQIKGSTRNIGTQKSKKGGMTMLREKNAALNPSPEEQKQNNGTPKKDEGTEIEKFF